jgi:predicted amidohydrolase YtcJ
VLIQHAEVEGRICDVRIDGERIASVAPSLVTSPGEETLDAEGGALLPGLHDHHLHLFALAAAEASVACGPPAVSDGDALRAALRAASEEAGGGEMLRGVGYHESVAGHLDRQLLDVWVPDRPLRIQHRSGALWMLNSRACALARLEEGEHGGIERDVAGRPTGRLFRADAWLRKRLPPTPPPDLASIGRRLAAFGVTGVTDATPGNGPEELDAFTRALARGALPQRLLLMGRTDLPESDAVRLERGPHKLLLSETDFPALDALAGSIAGQHAAERSVAIHSVTRAELVFALAAFEQAGVRRGDRIEHASIAPPECRDALARLGLAVVTQPNFVLERGDAYRSEVDPGDRPYLYCAGSLAAAGVALGGGTDAPFGDPDPWAAMRAAVERRTRAGAPLGPDEALAPERALALFTTTATDPGGPPRRVVAGAAADLCLLHRPWKQARTALSSRDVRLGFCAGAPLS